MSGDKVRIGGAWVNVCPNGGGIESTVKEIISASATTGGTAHTAGSWVEVIASAAVDLSWVWLEAATTFTVNTNSVTLLDIGVGGSGSEAAVISNIPVGNRQNSIIGGFPISIAAGSRVSIRVRGAQTSTSKSFYLSFGSNGETSNPTAVVLGSSTSNSKGVSLADPASSDTATPVWGAWTQVVASTADRYVGLLFVPQLDGNASVGGTYALRLDFGYGGSGSETSFGFNSWWSASSSEVITPTTPNIILTNTLINVDVAAGTRLVARYARGGSSVDMDMSIIAVPYV